MKSLGRISRRRQRRRELKAKGISRQGLRAPLRGRVAMALGRATAQVSRRLGRGSGTVIGGRVTLAFDPIVLRWACEQRQVVLVSGTNGKTTTTHLLAAALRSRGGVVANLSGSNMPPGLAASLGSAPAGLPAVFEVDERWLAHVIEQTQPVLVVLLNLSRDQLDRVGEVRSTSLAWRAALEEAPGTRVVANADDPLVAWAAQAASEISWVSAGLSWRVDATSCPVCTAPIRFEEAWWCCPGCGFSRPTPAVSLGEDDIVDLNGRHFPLSLQIPGRYNTANAAMALAAAVAVGLDPEATLQEFERTTEVAGRYRVVSLGAREARLLLAKNPAGWGEIFTVLQPAPNPVVVAINARIADGRDTSWLWDVPFEQLRGRLVVATGERSRDLAVRLRYAGVNFVHEPDLLAALSAVDGAEAGEHGPVATFDVIGNYTAFETLTTRLRRVS